MLPFTKENLERVVLIQLRKKDGALTLVTEPIHSGNSRINIGIMPEFKDDRRIGFNEEALLFLVQLLGQLLGATFQRVDKEHDPYIMYQRQESNRPQ